MRRRKLNSSFRTPGCPLMIRFSKSVRILIEARGAKRRQRSEVRGQKSMTQNPSRRESQTGYGSVVRRCTSTYEPSAMKAETGFALSGSTNFSAIECGDVGPTQQIVKSADPR